ncbi:MAG: hypothetical protein JWM57_1646 [Phycisphaerales bacterium]|nr:hypothetical protein [Phycisphaerales bacterium]
MSAFTPDIPPVPRPDQAELLGRFVPTALRRVPPVAKIWPIPRLVLMAVVTAGFYPCRALQVRLRQTLMMHAQQCELASQLLDKHLPADDALAVRDAAGEVRVGFGWLNVSAVMMLAALAMLAAWLWRADYSTDAVRHWWLGPPDRGDTLAIVSISLLGGAFLVLIAQINQQILAMQKFVLAFNAVADNRMRALDLPSLVFGLKPIHLILGLVGAWLGLFWFLPMMLAWAAFTAFVRDSAYQFRVQLADRLGTVSGVAPVIPLRELCPNPDCRFARPTDAQFCPRCGTPIPA